MVEVKQYYVNSILPLPMGYHMKQRALKFYGSPLKEYYVCSYIYMVNTRTINDILVNMRRIINKMEEENLDKFMYMPFTNMYQISWVDKNTFRAELVRHCFTKSPHFLIKRVNFPEGDWYKCPEDILKIIEDIGENKVFIYNNTKMRYEKDELEIVETGERVKLMIV